MVGDCVLTSMVGDMVLFSSYFEFSRPCLSVFGFVYVLCTTVRSYLLCFFTVLGFQKEEQCSLVSVVLGNEIWCSFFHFAVSRPALSEQQPPSEWGQPGVCQTLCSFLSSFGFDQGLRISWTIRRGWTWTTQAKYLPSAGSAGGISTTKLPTQVTQLLLILWSLLQPSLVIALVVSVNGFPASRTVFFVGQAYTA